MKEQNATWRWSESTCQCLIQVAYFSELVFFCWIMLWLLYFARYELLSSDFWSSNRLQTESDAYEPTAHGAQVGSKSQAWIVKATISLLATRQMVGHESQYKLCKGQQISPFKPHGRFCSFLAGWLIWDSWLHILNLSTLRPFRCETWERFPIYARQTWLPWKPIGPLTLCTCPPPSLQVWCPSACKHQRSRLTKFNYDFLVKCGLKACFSCFHDNRVGISWRQYFSCHPRPKTHPLAKTQSKSDWNWRKIKDSDIRVLYKR